MSPLPPPIVPPGPPPPLKRIWEIWAEGYRATCEHGTATFIGQARGDTFDEAAMSLHDERRHGPVGRDRYGHLMFWNCRLYASEDEARVSYG